MIESASVREIETSDGSKVYDVVLHHSEDYSQCLATLSMTSKAKAEELVRLIDADCIDICE